MTLDQLTDAERALIAGPKSPLPNRTTQGTAWPTTYRVPARDLTSGMEVWHEGRWQAVHASARAAGRTRVRVVLAKTGELVYRRQSPVAVRS